MIGLISCVLAVIGICGFFAQNLVLLYVGFVAVIVEHFIGIVSGQQKGITTLVIASTIALLISSCGVAFLDAIAICMCVESIICNIGGLILIAMMYNKNK